jgi:eukaryotic-like serine/threonine-protein kinase
MGQVYKAKDVRLGRFVALKVLNVQSPTGSDQRQRFVQEARAASTLNHPGIVTIYDVGSQQNIDYIAMEFVEGKTLDMLIPPRGFPLAEVLLYSTQAADAIAKAHSASILHRDLKPANFIVTGEGVVKVLDFGLAKFVQPIVANGEVATGTIAPLTEDGRVMGTPNYMSPEQAEGKHLDSRSDIFSFGSVLYEMSTGQRAFSGSTIISTIGCVLRDEPKSIREIRQDAPEELERLVLRCLRKDPERRVQTMSDLRVALGELKHDSESGLLIDSELRPRRKTVFHWAGIVVLSCILVALIGSRFLTRASNPRPAHSVPLTSYQGDERQADFSPDGSQVVFVWNGDRQDNWDIYLKVVGSSAAPLRLTTDPAADSNPKWSPDGKTIAFIRSTTEDDSVMLMSALGGEERRLTVFPAAIDAGLSWSPDGKWLAVSVGERQGPTALQLFSLETGASRVLTNPPASDAGDFDPAFSPDGRSLAFVRERGMNVDELWIFPLTRTYQAQGEPRNLLSDGKKNRNPVWSTDGRELIFSSGESAFANLFRMPADGSRPPNRIDATGDGVTEPAVSLSSQTLAYSRTFRSATIWRLDRKSVPNRAEQFIASSSFRDAFPQYSPDGKRIAFFSNRTGLNQIWTCDADGSKPAQLTSMSGTTTGTPRWSPDGEWISFDSNSGGFWQIYLIPSTGGKPIALTQGDSSNVLASWSRDGKWIYFTSKRSGAEEVWRVSSRGGTDAPPIQVTHYGGTSSLESPDGTTLYVTRTNSRFEFSLWKMPVNGGQESQVLNSLHRYNFVVSEKAIFYTTPSLRDKPAEVMELNIANGKTTSLYKLTKRVDLGLAVSPDSRYLLFVQLDSAGSDLMSIEGFR